MQGASSSPTSGSPEYGQAERHYLQTTYFVKEVIMKATCGKPVIDFDGAQLSPFPGLSHCTLMQCQAVCPLLEGLRSVSSRLPLLLEGLSEW